MRLENVFEGAGAGEITVGFELEIIVPSIKPKEFWSDEQASDLDNKQVKQIQVIQNKYGLTQHADDSVVPGPDDWDTHHGTEYDIGMIKGPGPTFTQTRLRVTPSDFLKVATIIKEFFEVDKIKMRFRPSHFPFTEPSAEVDIGYEIKDG